MKFGDLVLILGYAASALVFATFFMRSRERLRQVGMVSNVAFITYGVIGDVVPVVVLHALLLPLNAWRLWEIAQTRKAIAAAMSGDIAPDWLEPFAAQVEVPAGQNVFARGDTGRTMFFIVAGTVRLVETGIDLGPGSLLGEIAIFSPQGTRTQTAAATTDARLLAMSQDDLLTLYRRHPDFGVFLLRLITRRLLENNAQLEALGRRA